MAYLVTAMALVVAGLVAALFWRRRWDTGKKKSGKPVLGWLQVHEHGNLPYNYPITSEVTKVGRSGGNEIALKDDAISQTHLEVRITDGNAVLTDLGSTNGTWINGAEVVQVILRNGEVIKLGETTIVFYHAVEAVKLG